MKKLVNKYQEKVLSAESDKAVYQILRYACAGAFSVAVDFALLYFLTELVHLHYWFSAGISYTLSTAMNYFITTRLVFAKQDHTKETVLFQIFVVIGLIGLALNQLFIFLFTVNEFHNVRVIDS